MVDGNALQGRNLSDVCQHCGGDCCKAINLIIRPSDRMKGLLAIHYGRQPEDIETVQLAIHHWCPHLLDDGRCELWHEDPAQDQRPEFCQSYLCEKALNPGVMILEVDG